MKKWYVEGSTDELPGCCGVTVLQDIKVFEDEDEYDDSNELFYGDGYTTEWRAKTPGTAIKMMTQKVRQENRRVICTLVDANKKDRMILDLFIKAGWKDLGTSDSNMSGRYKIHMLEIQRPRRRRKAK